ncbi:MAG: response regulator, partial [Lachnospiraceae bacterium]|nr:response regulator [Lachnospiraceae bacterium]
MERLFESFERLDKVRNRNIEGTGLGMSITTNLLSLMNSELKVESTYGKGSVFYFELWQKIEDETPMGDYNTGTQKSEVDHNEKDHLYAPDAHILIVDDTKMNLTVAVKLLKRTAINVTTSDSGEMAVALSSEHKYDLIFMDQRMPNMDGTETMKAIRALENGLNADTPVICLTADAIRGAKDKYVAQGFTDYLSKPVNGKSLEETLLKYLPPETISRKEE